MVFQGPQRNETSAVLLHAKMESVAEKTGSISRAGRPHMR